MLSGLFISGAGNSFEMTPIGGVLTYITVVSVSISYAYVRSWKRGIWTWRISEIDSHSDAVQSSCVTTVFFVLEAHLYY